MDPFLIFKKNAKNAENSLKMSWISPITLREFMSIEKRLNYILVNTVAFVEQISVKQRVTLIMNMEPTKLNLQIMNLVH